MLESALVCVSPAMPPAWIYNDVDVVVVVVVMMMARMMMMMMMMMMIISSSSTSSSMGLINGCHASGHGGGKVEFFVCFVFADIKS